FTIINFGQRFDQLFGELVYELTEPTGCLVRTKRELMITSTSVGDDPSRAQHFGFPDGLGRTALPSQGPWTFGHLVRDLAPSPADAPALVEQTLRTWLTDQPVNSFTIFSRPAIQNTLIDQFPRLPDGSLDLDRAP